MRTPKFKKSNLVTVGFATTTLLVLFTTALTACAPAIQSTLAPVGAGIDETLGCMNFEESMWKSFNQSVEQDGRPPTASEIESSLKFKLKASSRLGGISANAKAEVSNLTADIAATIQGLGIEAISKAKAVESKTSNVAAVSLDLSDEDTRRAIWLERLAQLELGDRTTKTKSDDVDRIQAKVSELKKVAEREGVIGVACSAAPVSPPVNNGPVAASMMLDVWKATQVPSVYGGLRTVATIYQSCDAATHSPLGSETSDVRGISVTGRHSSGTGNVRQITNKSAYLASHPYVGNGIYKRPLPSCHDVQSTPSIYDYGGKPHSTSSNDKVLNMFRNAGTGSKELGIDCSALVYTAYATVGLKFKKETGLKASLVNGVSSSMLTEPKKNGLSCLDHATFTARKSIAPGDIIAIKGHVVMVSSVGSDPFGIASINSASDCRSSNMDIDDFNFNIFQSDPSKGGIGVNQMRARYYLSSWSAMGRGMIDHAVNACKAKFLSSGIVSKSSSASVVRHLGTPACSDPVPVQLTKEECLSSCSARTVDSI